MLSSDQMKEGLYRASSLGHMHDYWKFRSRSTPRSILAASVLEDIAPMDISIKRVSARTFMLKEQFFGNRLCLSTMNFLRLFNPFLRDPKPNSHLDRDWVEEFLYFQMRYSSSKRPIPDKLRRVIPNGAAYHVSVVQRMSSEDISYRPANQIDVFVIIDHPFLHAGWAVKHQEDFIGEYRILGGSQYYC
ncbi:hypothetical protein BDV26DRAFT_269004 [Aspergillus bertholletiae]|uniref:Uncharacterized protein n=1 Tax=Aspergillus bertholletiae TaxID=1226010 RepID=A0A5N7AYG9_9EURO|nr:hypothetical protein BDV26DRAFT_269004 [Aspergillus bertholletiae]